MQEDESLSSFQRKAEFKQWIERGDRLYQRGIAANPDDLKLRLERARLWSSPMRILDYEKVVEILESCLSDLTLSDSRVRRIELNTFYSLLRIPGREQQAYALGRRLYDADRSGAPSSLRNGLCALQLHPRLEPKQALTLGDLYGSKELAARYVARYLDDQDPDKPRYGMAELLKKLTH